MADDFEAENTWKKELEVAREHYAPSDLKEQFGPGSVGFHEVIDRIHVQAATWADHIASHPGVTLDQERHRRAHQILDLMHELYQLCGRQDWDAEQCLEAKDDPDS